MSAPNPPPLLKVEDLIGADAIERLRDAYDDAEVARLLEVLTPSSYPGAEKIFSSIVNTYYRGLDLDPDDEDLTPADRQRCVVALQAGRGEELPLSIHLYIGLMEGISPSQLAHIILLAGVYNGVPVAFKGIDVLKRTLASLAALAADVQPNSDVPAMLVLKTLKGAMASSLEELLQA